MPEDKQKVRQINKNNISFESSVTASAPGAAMRDDEIDLAELFHSLWAQKRLIACVAGVCLLISAVYAVKATPEYQSSAVFQISSGRSVPTISAELSGFARIAGLDVGGESPAQGVFDRLQGRDFILGVAGELALDRDPYFNPYAGGGDSPARIGGIASRIKALAAPAFDAENSGGQERLAEDAIVAKFGKAVTVSETKNGSIEIEARHEDPVRASALANTSVNRLLTALDAERKDGQAKQLAYLSEQLADALTAMKESQERVQDFALKNSFVLTIDFETRSELMFRLRAELERSREMRAATAELLRLAGPGSSPSRQDHADLRRNFPIVDDLDFRRLLGISAAIDQWSWPTEKRLLEFQNILSDRVVRARREVEKLQVEAAEHAEASEELMSLERDASIAEATYQLLIEQTKNQSFAAGFDTEIAKIYQMAVPATRAIAPDRPLVVALGAVLGLFTGAVLAVLRGARRGRLYSAGALREAARARLFLRTPMRPLRTGKPQALLASAEKLRPEGLVALAIDLNEKSPGGILCVSAGSQTHAAGPAMWIAAHLAKDNARIAMVDLSGGLTATPDEEAQGAGPLWSVAPMNDRIDLLTPDASLQADDLLLRKSFGQDVATLMSRYDRVVFAVAPAHAAAAHRLLHPLAFYLVALCGGGLADKSILDQLRDVAPIDACLSET